MVGAVQFHDVHTAGGTQCSMFGLGQIQAFAAWHTLEILRTDTMGGLPHSGLSKNLRHQCKQSWLEAIASRLEVIASRLCGHHK